MRLLRRLRVGRENGRGRGCVWGHPSAGLESLSREIPREDDTAAVDQARGSLDYVVVAQSDVALELQDQAEES